MPPLTQHDEAFEDQSWPWMCVRCRTENNDGEKCAYCGVGRDRPVRYIRRRTIGGKRGRNSGKVGTAKKS